MPLPSPKVLAKIAVYGAVISITSVMYMRYKIEEGVRKSDYFRAALVALRHNKGVVQLLGEPIKEMGFDLSQGDKNYVDGKRAHFEVSVKGPKDRGKIFFDASRDDDSGWKLDQLELEVKSFPEKRFIVRSADMNPNNNNTKN